MTEIEETVERVARALFYQDNDARDYNWETDPKEWERVEYQEAARAAIAAMPSPWRTIDSAPKDGTWILVGGVNLHPCDAHWAHDRVGDAWDWMDGFGPFAAQPTHWQPLPIGPTGDLK
jgi:hypothetical protein